MFYIFYLHIELNATDMSNINVLFSLLLLTIVNLESFIDAYNEIKT